MKALFPARWRRLASACGQRLKQLNVNRTTELLTQLRSMIVSLAVLAVVVALALIVVRQMTSGGVVVEPVRVPAAAVASGHSGDVFTRWMVDEIQAIQNESITRKSRRSLIPDSSRFDLEMPGSGLSVKAMGQVLREGLGRPQSTISGEIVQAQDGYRLRLRFVGDSGFAWRLVGPSETIDALLGAGAEKAVEMVSPFVLAAYFYGRDPGEHRDRIDALLDASLRNRTRDDDAWAHNLRGLLQAYHGNFLQAYASFERAIEASPQFAPALNNWGNVLLRDEGRGNNYVEAAEKFEAAFSLDPELTRAKASGLYARGMQYKFDGEYVEAVVRFKQAIAIDPDFPDAHQEWGFALLDRCAAEGVSAEERARLAGAAIRQYQRAIELAPESKSEPLTPMIEALGRDIERARADPSGRPPC